MSSVRGSYQDIIPLSLSIGHSLHTNDAEKMKLFAALLSSVTAPVHLHNDDDGCCRGLKICLKYAQHRGVYCFHRDL